MIPRGSSEEKKAEPELMECKYVFFQATYRYTHPGSAWTSMGDMTGDRYNHGCGTYKDAGGILYLIVVGGMIGENTYLATAEKYDFAASSWV